MQYRLRSLLLFALVVAASMAAGGLSCVFFVLLFLAPWLFMRQRLTPVGFLVWFGCVGMVMALLFPSTYAPRYAARAKVCKTNFERIASALEAYREDHGHYPPAAINDADGKPMHSWRVLILPYMGYQDVYDQYDLSQPWDSPANSKLVDRIPAEYRCSWGWPPGVSPSSSYYAIVGPGTAWPGANAITKGDIHDSPADTILIVEIDNDLLESVYEQAIPWMQPEDLAVDEFLAASGSANAMTRVHVRPDSKKHGRHVLMADGTVRFAPETLPNSTLESLLTINGGEEIDVDRLGMPRPYQRTPRWKKVSAYVVLVFSIVVLLFATRRRAEKPPAPEKQ